VTDDDGTGKNFIGTSLWVASSLIPELGVIFYELDYGRRLGEHGYALAGAHIYRFDAPMSADDGARYPGRVVSYGPIIGYQYVFRSRVFVSQLFNPMVLDYRDPAGKNIGTGYMLLFATRMGYQFNFAVGGLSLYLELSAEFNVWPFYGGAPTEFREIDREYAIYTWAPAFNAGIRF
jgi:hypothetical protein